MFGIPNGGWMPHLCSVDHGTGSFVGPDSGHHDDRRGCRGLRKWNLSTVRPGCIQGKANALSLPSHFGCWRLRRAILGNGWLPRQNSAGNLGLSESRVPISSS